MNVFTNDERTGLNQSRSITTDSSGQELLVGLTLEETIFCMEHRRSFLAGTRDHSGKKRYLELMEKHKVARLSALGTEIQFRNESPTRH